MLSYQIMGFEAKMKKSNVNTHPVLALTAAQTNPTAIVFSKMLEDINDLKFYLFLSKKRWKPFDEYNGKLLSFWRCW